MKILKSRPGRRNTDCLILQDLKNHVLRAKLSEKIRCVWEKSLPIFQKEVPRASDITPVFFNKRLMIVGNLMTYSKRSWYFISVLHVAILLSRILGCNIILETLDDDDDADSFGQVLESFDRQNHYR